MRAFDRVLDAVMFRILDRKARRLGAAFAAAAGRPEEVQLDLLRSILRRERSTGFGRDHRFDEIRDVRDFRRNVPVSGHEYFEPYVRRVYEGDTSALFHRQKLVMFAMTSGTSSARKLVPVLRERAAETNELRRIPEATIRDFWDADLFYFLRPKKFGGPEVRLDDAWAVAAELGRGDGSAAWVWAIITVHDLFVAYFPEETQKEFWGKKVLSASSFMPGGTV